MQQNRRDFEMDQGSTLSERHTMSTEGGLGLDLTGFDARMQVRKGYGKRVEVNCTLQNGKIFWIDAAQGVLGVKLAPADTSGITFASPEDETLELVYDMELMSPDGTVYKPVQGGITLYREVTR